MCVVVGVSYAFCAHLPGWPGVRLPLLGRGCWLGVVAGFLFFLFFFAFLVTTPLVQSVLPFYEICFCELHYLSVGKNGWTISQIVL